MQRQRKQTVRAWEIPVRDVTPGDLGRQLEAARRCAGLTQAELAGRLGISQAQVARLEQRGYHGYTLRSLGRYVAALGEEFSLALSVRRGATPMDTAPYIVAPH